MTDLQYVLELVNEARAVVGLDPLSELPKGKMAETRSCPLAKALPHDACVFDGTAAWEVTQRQYPIPHHIAEVWKTPIMCVSVGQGDWDCTVTLPYELRRFVIEFDNQVWPELIDVG